jgi:signal transduction histidine kinase
MYYRSEEPVLGDVANSVGLQAIVGAIARTGDAAFDLHRTLRALAEVAKGFAGARGVAVEKSRDDGSLHTILSVGETAGSPRRLSIFAEGAEIGFLAIYNAPMFGPATADRTQLLADLAAAAFMRAERILERSRPPLEDAKFRLISGVSHNLRNTLGAAIGYLQLIELEASLNTAQEQYVIRSRSAINAAVGLIGDLLELTRADAGKMSFDREPMNVNAVTREAVRNHRETARGKQCELEVITAADNPVVMTDTSYVQQIIDVLVYNALRYTPQEGRITVSVEVRGGRRTSDPQSWVCVSVSDTGGGVADAQNVFEEVHRVEQAKGNVRFRLAICRRIARLLGGDVTLESKKNGGSTFTLWLPVEAAAASAVEAPARVQTT